MYFICYEFVFSNFTIFQDRLKNMTEQGECVHSA